MRIVVADWLARGIISPTGKAARIYGPGGLDAEFGSGTSRLEAERWFAGKCRRQGLKTTMYTADEVATLHTVRPRVDAAEVEAEAKRLAAVPFLQRFACARLSQPCLSESCSDFSATFTTIAFDNSSLRWLEIST